MDAPASLASAAASAIWIGDIGKCGICSGVSSAPTSAAVMISLSTDQSPFLRCLSLGTTHVPVAFATSVGAASTSARDGSC